MRLSVLRVSAVTVAALVTVSLASTQSLQRYGSGTAGTGGKVPFLWATSMPRPGNTAFGLAITRGRANGVAIPFLAAREANLKVGSLTVLVDLATSLPLGGAVLDGSGAGTLAFPLPNVPALVGLTFFSQAFVPDSGASMGVSATQGLRVRVSEHGLVLGTRSTGSSSPQIAIRLDSGVRSTFSSSSMTNLGIPGLYPKNGTHCIAGSGRTGKVALFDCRVFPPKFVREFSSNFTPWCTTWHPDGVRLYVVNQSSSSNRPSIDVYWGLPAAANFGTPYPGASIPLGGTIDADRLVFTSDGNTGILSTLGLFGGGGELRKYDTKLNSPTYHQQTGLYKVRGRYIWDMCRIDDFHFAIAHSALAGAMTLEIINIATMKSVQSWNDARFGRLVDGLSADPSERYLYLGKRSSYPGSILRINVDRSDPNYGKIVTINAGIKSNWGVYDVKVNDAGDRVYAIVGAGIQTSFVGAIHEYDTSTQKLLRSWNMDRLGNLYNLLVR